MPGEKDVPPRQPEEEFDADERGWRKGTNIGG